MQTKFKRVLRQDGYYWLAFVSGNTTLFLYRQAPAGSRMDMRGGIRPGTHQINAR